MRNAQCEPQVAGAASHDAADWQTINWSKAQRIVRRLQARIVQATQAGRWGKVKALQRLLTHSYSGKVVAVRRVTENHGNRTPGVDRETWNTPAKKATAVQRLRQRGYHPQPLRRVYIAKRTGTKRGIVTLSQGQSWGRTKSGKKVQDLLSSATLCCQLDPSDLV
ncbi:MAG: reverse transcriptase N-terminal domain-containing protein, partial [Herpetosiphonaceae bacterium]|nr:reverse transcriptase N-terminal domain-containing protein [Herpetosiphonaceae bacterium]